MAPHVHALSSVHALGHYQIFLIPQRCPLIRLELGLFDRIMYCSGCLSYTVGALSSPVYIAAPVLTILIGMFPVVLTPNLTKAITAYAVASYLLLYCVCPPKKEAPKKEDPTKEGRKRERCCGLKALWFAHIANNILWWVFVKAFWRIALPCLPRSIFKPTKKEGKGTEENTLQDMWPHYLSLFVLFITMLLGIVQIVLGAKANSPLLLALLWIVYDMVPPFLLICHALRVPKANGTPPDNTPPNGTPADNTSTHGTPPDNTPPDDTLPDKMEADDDTSPDNTPPDQIPKDALLRLLCNCGFIVYFGSGIAAIALLHHIPM